MGRVRGLVLDGCWAVYDALGRLVEHLLPECDPWVDDDETADPLGHDPGPFGVAQRQLDADGSTMSDPCATQDPPGATCPGSDEK